jgi:hypothetical protein
MPNSSTLWLVACSAVVFVVVAIVGTPSLLSLFVDDIADRGSFGDQFGFCNALFSGTAFIGVVLALSLQRIELQLQRAFNEKQYEEQNKLERKKLSLELYKEWHSEELTLLRKQAALLLKNGEPLKNLAQLTQVFDAGKEPAAGQAYAVIGVFHFFERWAYLKQAELLDHELLAKMLCNNVVDWWHVKMLEKLKIVHERNHERNQGWIEVHRVIAEQLLDENWEVKHQPGGTEYQPEAPSKLGGTEVRPP